MFMGGGGFIFPRWFLKEFPGSPRIEVAELDPAVYRAAVEELGLVGPAQRRILTSIGDARNFVDDRLRENQRLVADGKPPVVYDFIYGDAFNDFSIPSHLTTREFLQKLHGLLSDDGVFQANIIDIYPREEYPGTTVGIGEVTYRGPLPRGMPFQDATRDFVAAGPRFAPLQIKSYGNGEYRIRAMQTIDKRTQNRLARADLVEEPVDSTASTWTAIIEDLATQTKQRRHFEGSIPSTLLGSEGMLEAWTPAPSPWQMFEACRLGTDGQSSRYVLGFRGIIAPNDEEQLVKLDPNNKEWVTAVRDGSKRSRAPGPGRFLGRYVATAADVFPNIYLFSTSSSQPGSDRDTFVMVCSRRPLNLHNLSDTGEWSYESFAALEHLPGEEKPKLTGQMASVLSLSEGQILTDDFAPVDNLLRPVFADQQ
jgi:hypothetical protein